MSTTGTGQGMAPFLAPGIVSSLTSINISSSKLCSNYFDPVKTKFTSNQHTFYRKGNFYHNDVPYTNGSSGSEVTFRKRKRVF